MFVNSKQLILEAELAGGRGDVAWQHSQLFRQSLNDTKEYPFSITLTFNWIFLLKYVVKYFHNVLLKVLCIFFHLTILTRSKVHYEIVLNFKNRWNHTEKLTIFCKNILINSPTFEHKTAQHIFRNIHKNIYNK